MLLARHSGMFPDFPASQESYLLTLPAHGVLHKFRVHVRAGAARARHVFRSPSRPCEPCLRQPQLCSHYTALHYTESQRKDESGPLRQKSRKSLSDIAEDTRICSVAFEAVLLWERLITSRDYLYVVLALLHGDAESFVCSPKQHHPQQPPTMPRTPFVG